tara:strand:+ start:113 stop:472 length:360 start_codon:yes stop_codon:yes gene_type:complete
VVAAGLLKEGLMRTPRYVFFARLSQILKRRLYQLVKCSFGDGLSLPMSLVSRLRCGVSGCLLQSFGSLQPVFCGRALKRFALPGDPVIVIAHWRSSTPGLHQLLAAHSGTGQVLLAPIR